MKKIFFLVLVLVLPETFSPSHVFGRGELRCLAYFDTGRKSDGLLEMAARGLTTDLPLSIAYFVFSMGPTTASFSDCTSFMDTLSHAEKERLIFLALNKTKIEEEIARRQGEFAEETLLALGCASRREAFFERVNPRFAQVFAEGEYGLSYAIRINRILEKTNVCPENRLRRFLTQMDEELSQKFPDFPKFPPNHFDGVYEKFLVEYRQKVHPLAKF